MKRRWIAWGLFLLSPILLHPTNLRAQTTVVTSGGGSSGGVTTAALKDATYCASTVGTDAYACTLPTAPANLAAVVGVEVSFLADVASTGASTIAFNGFDAVPIVKVGPTITTATLTNDIRAGMMVTGIYDGTSFQCVTCDGNRASLASANTWAGTGVFSAGAVQSFQGGLTTLIIAVTTTATTSNTTSLQTYTNTGDTDGATITLQNDPSNGASWYFAVTAAQTMTIVASAGETLIHEGATCGTSLTSNTIGSTIMIRVVISGSGGTFMTFGGDSGTWVCNA